METLHVQTKKERLFNINELLILVILLLSFMDFYLYTLHLMVIAFVVFCLLKGRVSIANGALPLLSLTVVLFIFWSGDIYSPTAWMKQLVWPASFLLGYNLVQPADLGAGGMEKAEKKAQICFVIAAVGFFVHLLLNIGINWGMEEGTRDTVDFWTGKSYAATGQAALMCVPMAWSIACVLNKEKLKIRLLAIFAILVMLYYNLTLGSRTVIVTLTVVTCLAVFYYLRTERVGKKKLYMMLTLVSIGVVFLIAYSVDLGGIRTAIDDSVLSFRLNKDDRLSIGGDVRWRTKLKYLKLMPQHLFGGSNILKTVGLYAHDILLDTYDEASVFAFLAILALLWDSASKLWRFLKCKQIAANTKMTVLCIYAMLYLEFAVEPIFAGMPWLLMTFCFFHGMITSLVKHASMVDGS